MMTAGKQFGFRRYPQSTLGLILLTVKQYELASFLKKKPQKPSS